VTTNLTLPQDNAVIDYSIISQLVNAINQQQATIDSITQASTDQGGGSVITKTAGGVIKANGTSQLFEMAIPVNGIQTVTSATFTAYNSASKPVSCWVSSTNGSRWQISTSVAVTQIYYIVNGTATA